MYSVPKITGLKFNEVNLKRSKVLSGMSWHFSHFLFKRYFPSFQLITKTITYVLLWSKKLFDPSKIYKVDSNIEVIVVTVNNIFHYNNETYLRWKIELWYIHYIFQICVWMSFEIKIYMRKDVFSLSPIEFVNKKTFLNRQGIFHTHLYYFIILQYN